MLQTNEMPVKAVIFARTSIHQQTGGSLEAQVHSLREYCKRKKLNIVNEFCLCDSSDEINEAFFIKVLNFIKEQKEPLVLVIELMDCLIRNDKYYMQICWLVFNGMLQVHVLKHEMIMGDVASCRAILGIENFASLTRRAKYTDNTEISTKRKSKKYAF